MNWVFEETITGPPPPLAGTMCRSRNSAGCAGKPNAILLPSGDQAGSLPPPLGSGASGPLPSAFFR